MLPDGTAFTKALFSSLPWDYHSAEKEGDYIKVIAKAQNNRRRPAVISKIMTDTNFIEVYTFDLKGNFIAADVPPSERNGFDTSIADDASRMA